VTGFSEAEKNLINFFMSNGLSQLEWIIKAVENENLVPPKAWDAVALEIFAAGPHPSKDPSIENAINAVREVVKACWKAEPNRHTPEFDRLCEFNKKAYAGTNRSENK
jgi:hypothetical protein